MHPPEFLLVHTFSLSYMPRLFSCLNLVRKCSFPPLTPSFPSPAGGDQADSEPAEGQQFPLRLARWGGVSTHESGGKGPPAERSLQRGGLHGGGCSLICQKGRRITAIENMAQAALWWMCLSLLAKWKPPNILPSSCFYRSFLKTIKQWLLWLKLLKRMCSSHTWMTMRGGTCF